MPAGDSHGAEPLVSNATVNRSTVEAANSIFGITHIAHAKPSAGRSDLVHDRFNAIMERRDHGLIEMPAQQNDPVARERSRIGIGEALASAWSIAI
jgi:hypothetical protein